MTADDAPHENKTPFPRDKSARFTNSKSFQIMQRLGRLRRAAKYDFGLQSS